MKKNSGIELWNKAKTIIPGGNQLLSKRSERFLPDQWPSYYDRAKGCEIWDLDGNHYYDFAQMGVGACVLGYAHDYVNEKVKQAIDKGSMATLNAPEEVALAERLLSLHPWASKVRFSRTGGEACSIAIRIARAATKKSKVAFCGYHGWHDWYLSANLSDGSNLDDQLLPGLNTKGVPRELAGTNHPFKYNDLTQLKAIAAEHGKDLACIIMEPVRNFEPEPAFLQGVRDIANQTGALLIFDEVTSGFRMNFGGIHLRYGVQPDLAVFGKALGNGYPISAIIGRNSMDVAQESFISSTFWTERIGFTAALATLDVMEKENVSANLIHYGEAVNAGWNRIAAKHGLKIHISGITPLTHIAFDYPNANAIQTLYCQEMLKRGFMLGASVYATNAYSDEIIAKFINASDAVFGMLLKGIASETIETLLEGPVMHSGFKRLT